MVGTNKTPFFEACPSLTIRAKTSAAIAVFPVPVGSSTIVFPSIAALTILV
jgi:hypothetical protein